MSSVVFGWCSPVNATSEIISDIFTVEVTCLVYCYSTYYSCTVSCTQLLSPSWPMCDNSYWSVSAFTWKWLRLEWQWHFSNSSLVIFVNWSFWFYNWIYWNGSQLVLQFRMCMIRHSWGFDQPNYRTVLMLWKYYWDCASQCRYKHLWVTSNVYKLLHSYSRTYCDIWLKWWYWICLYVLLKMIFMFYV